MKIFLICLLSVFSLASFGQTTTLSFSTISTSAADFNRPGGGAEQWTARQNTVNIPTAGTNTTRVDAYFRFNWINFQTINGAQGTFTFTKFDQEIQDAINKGQGFSFGIMHNCCGGDGSVGGADIEYPIWLHTLMQAEAHKDWNNGGYWEPNYNSTNYIAAFTALHQAVNTHIQNGSFNGVRYRDVVKRIDVRIVGEFSEQTTQATGPDNQYPTDATFMALVDAVVNSYPDIKCTNMIGSFSGSTGFGITSAAVGKYQLQKTNNAGLLGWRWDSWGWTDGYIHSWLEGNNTVVSGFHFDTAIMNRYKYGPVTGEPADLNNAGHFEDLPVRVPQYHAESFGNGNLDHESNNTTTAANFRAASKLAGYRLTLTTGSMTTSPATGGTCAINLTWSNVNVTPPYDNWRIVYEWRNSSTGALLQRDTATFNLKLFISSSFADNENFTLRTVPAGTADLYMKVVDPTGFRKPMPLFITTTQGADGAYLLRAAVPITASGAVANAGTNQSIVITSATLNGSASVGATSYAWTRLSGPNTPSIVTPTTASTSVTGLITGTYVFQLAINGGSSGQLISQVNVIVNATPVQAVAGNSQTITLPTASVTLNGSGSTGATTYAWTNVSGPNTPTINAPTSVNTGVTGFIAGNYIFQLSINAGASTSQTSVTVLPVNVPVSNAGVSRTITLPTATVTLDGTGSSGTITSRLWTRVSGPNTPTITTPTTATTTVTGLAQGVYVFQLALNGGSVDTCQVTVNAAIPPSQSATTIFTTQAPTYGTQNANMHVALTVGVKFRSTSAGYITGVRYYREQGNNATHTGLLYTSAGTLLASATPGNPTTYGWITIPFSSPIPISANTTYVAAVWNSNEFYSIALGQLNTAITNGPLTALAQGFDGGNGLYIYNAAPTFPTNVSAGDNFWIDVVLGSLAPGSIFNVYYIPAP